MKTQKFQNLLIALPLLALALTAQAQRGPVAAGGDATGAGGTSSYSIGQIDYLNLTGANPTITQGLQQPYEIYLITATDDPSEQISASVYPNPTKESIILDLGDLRYQNLQFTLHDQHGRLLQQQPLKKAQNPISLTGLAKATYYLTVLRGDAVLKSFKIIKIH